MKEKFLNFTFCLFCLISIFFIFINNQEVAKILIEAVNLFFKKVFVSLFPMFIINDLLISLNMPYYFYKIFHSLFSTIFKTSGICAYVFIMSLISGTPSNAYILKSLVENDKLSKAEASHYLYFTYFSNPLFLTLMLSLIFEVSTVIKIISIHYISNIIIGLYMRKKAPKITECGLTIHYENISKALIKSINKSISTLLMILGTIVFYMLLSYIIVSLLPHNSFIKTIISGILEITNGLNSLKMLDKAYKVKEILAIAIISFGGLSIHTQIKSILEDTKIDYISFLKGRILHVLISVGIIILI